MNWLNSIVESLIDGCPPDEVIIVSSGVSPSGTYHLGTLREVLTAEAIYRELVHRGRAAKHVHVVDDLDIFRKVPKDVDESFSQYLGMPLCDIPSPDKDKATSYADYFLSDLLVAGKGLHLKMDVLRAHEKYRAGYFVDVIEKTLKNIPSISSVLEEVSGRKLDPNWSPVQVIENGRLKNRAFVELHESEKKITYMNSAGEPEQTSYANGNVKLNWRIDWPARWWKLGVRVEPFGRDHATKGGSYDTGAMLVEQVFGGKPPIPVPYNFINKTGDTKKMSKSAGDTITAADLLKILPPELVWFFILRFSPDKLLFFDTGETLVRLFDEFSELLAKPDKSEQEQQLLRLCLQGIEQPTVSRVPFTHLYVSYQASLRNPNKTIEVIQRTEHAVAAKEDEAILLKELSFIDAWLDAWAGDELVFSVAKEVSEDAFTPEEKSYLHTLADRIEQAPSDADGEWFHKTVYSLKDSVSIEPKKMFAALYKVLIQKESGPRAGWFLSSLDREWLVKRLRFEA
jgi:lysyl-tRNA synthetase class 1